MDSFIQGNFTVPKHSKIAVSNITIRYCWFNITSSYNDQRFQITWTTGTTLNTNTITLPYGFYAMSDVHNYLQQCCISNGLYFIDNNGNYMLIIIV